ncbi:class D beta-lactamase [Jiella avicenniae]|uniref:Class D beta-lactamase n=1 Tax=Jiella avicenniae TaxID=2907202 RepID=A0A9X1TDM4_9HYPH|nr:class D beta-lactamase [Jiella avicenniae]MCE7030298.1 class D beta-lactamase [Jiella avicenniae]
MKRLLALGAVCAVWFAQPLRAETQTLCLTALDAASGRTLVETGPACDARVTPASTFKLAIGLMGFDAGILKSADEPKLPFRQGYVDWRPEWRQATTPATWMRDSVVWYSQRVMEKLGRERAQGYLGAFRYGNEDISGLPGEGNGLIHAWLGNSLAISPREEAEFMGRIVRRELGVSARAYEMTAAIAAYGTRGDGWEVYGKTGAGLPRGADGKLVRGRAYGWFVGWGRKGERTVVFAKLVQDSEKQSVPPGFRARDMLFDELFAEDGLLD